MKMDYVDSISKRNSSRALKKYLQHVHGKEIGGLLRAGDNINYRDYFYPTNPNGTSRPTSAETDTPQQQTGNDNISLSFAMTSLDNTPEVAFPKVRNLIYQFNKLIASGCNAKNHRRKDKNAECFIDKFASNETNRSHKPNIMTNNEGLVESSGGLAALDFLENECDINKSLQWNPSISDKKVPLTKDSLARLDSGAGDLFVHRSSLCQAWSKDTLSAKQCPSSHDSGSGSYLSQESDHSPSNSVEDNINSISRSTSCEHLEQGELRNRWQRSNSSDSAVVVEDETSQSTCISPIFESNSYINNSMNCEKHSANSYRNSMNCDKPSANSYNSTMNCKTTVEDCNTDLFILRKPNNGIATLVDTNVPIRRHTRPPSVVISDHSGESVSVHVALASEGFNLDNVMMDAPYDFLSHDCGYGYPKKVSECSTSSRKVSECSISSSISDYDCPRKVSECSTCSCVSGYVCPKKVSECSTCFSVSGYVCPKKVSECSTCFSVSGYVCPRKVSECSTCSSVSTIDMNKTDFDLPSSSGFRSRRGSDCSSCYLSASEEEVEVSLRHPTPPPVRKSSASSNWRKVRNVVQWTPFIQTYKRHKYPWVQLAGHQGNFRAGYKQGTIMKKLCPAEEKAFVYLMTDVLKPYVPEYLGVVDGSDNEKYLQLQDLLSDFSSACVMDIKMGVRTYLEEELAKARIKPKLRKDMYDKMVQINTKAPTEAEHRAKAVTKPRYMVWRETISSTATLGFRIEGVRRGDGTSSKDFKTTRTGDQVSKVVSGFVDGYPDVMAKYIERLKQIRKILENSNFFKSHELIGSSLLFVHNKEKCGVWLIDFAKTIPLPDGVRISHKSPWIEGTHEDGYFIGLNNLIQLMQDFVPPESPDENISDSSAKDCSDKGTAEQDSSSGVPPEKSSGIPSLENTLKTPPMRKSKRK